MTAGRHVYAHTFVLLAVILAAGGASAQQQQQEQEWIGVGVKKEVRSDGVRYEYTVLNPTEREIVTLIIGTDVTQFEPQLDRLPIGWKEKESTLDGFGWTIGGPGVLSPNGWKSLVMFFEERDRFALSWTIIDLFEEGVVQAKRSGFLVNLAAADDGYEKGSWSVIFADGTQMSGILNDTAPVPE